MADWFAFAEDDLTAAKICAKNYPPLVEIACFVANLRFAYRVSLCETRLASFMLAGSMNTASGSKTAFLRPCLFSLLPALRRKPFQRCAEKTLKGFLTLNGITPPKTHDLRELCRLSESKDSDFSKISNECILLSPYGVNVRYPNTIEVEESDMRKAITDAEKILAFVENKIRDMR